MAYWLQYSCPENPMDRRAWQLWSMGLPRVGHESSNLPRCLLYIFSNELFYVSQVYYFFCSELFSCAWVFSCFSHIWLFFFTTLFSFIPLHSCCYSFNLTSILTLHILLRLLQIQRTSSVFICKKSSFLHARSLAYNIDNEMQYTCISISI